MSTIGRQNVYTCETCKESIVTVHRDDGTTPIFLLCKATPQCSGRMVSSYYPSGPLPDPEWEWYRPHEKAAKRMGPGMLDYTRMGGLSLRRVSVMRATRPSPKGGA